MGFIYMISKTFMTVFEWSKIARMYVANVGDIIPNITATMFVHW